MREIKFRQFDALYKVMVEWNQLKEDIKQYGFEKLSKSSIFMQFTGLKDRNGKEIYESDLLLIHGDKCLIEYDLKSASFIARSTNQDSYWALDEDTFKLGVRVIGNIYENPKLLNQ